MKGHLSEEQINKIIDEAEKKATRLYTDFNCDSLKKAGINIKRSRITVEKRLDQELEKEENLELVETLMAEILAEDKELEVIETLMKEKECKI